MNLEKEHGVLVYMRLRLCYQGFGTVNCVTTLKSYALYRLRPAGETALISLDEKNDEFMSTYSTNTSNTSNLMLAL